VTPPRHDRLAGWGITLKAVLTQIVHHGTMVTRRRLRSFLKMLALYAAASAGISYFAVNAYTGNLGLRAKQDLDQQIAQSSAELAAAKAERSVWEHRVALLRSDNLDPDLLDERARLLLGYVDPRDLTLMFKHP
jgi:cell division protein FtsB